MPRARRPHVSAVPPAKRTYHTKPGWAASTLEMFLTVLLALGFMAAAGGFIAAIVAIVSIVGHA